MMVMMIIQASLILIMMLKITMLIIAKFDPLLKKYGIGVYKVMFIMIMITMAMTMMMTATATTMRMTMMRMMGRTEYMRWKYRNNKDDKISVDESGMTQFDPLLKWEVAMIMIKMIMMMMMMTMMMMTMMI